MCLPRDEHFLSLVVDAPRDLRSPACAGREARPIATISAQDPTRFRPLPLFDSHFQCEMGGCEKGGSRIDCQW
jgi:hypothetical protein